MGGHHSVLPVILDLRIKARELKRQSDRCYRESLQERDKIRRALLRQNQEGARISAQNFVRKKQESLNALHMASKLEAVASRLDSAHRSHQLTTKIHSVASGLSTALRKLDSSSSLREIELFSKLFDDLDVRSDSVSSLLDVSTSSAMPTQQVEKVLTEVADAFGIQLEESTETGDSLLAAFCLKEKEKEREKEREKEKEKIKCRENSNDLSNKQFLAAYTPQGSGRGLRRHEKEGIK